MSADKRNFSIILAVIVSCLLWFGGQCAYASHFRYGHISWTAGSGNQVNFTVDQSWRRTFFGGGSDPDGSAAIGDIINTGTLFFGDGSSASVLLEVTSIDKTNDWFFGRFTTSYTYSSTGFFTAFFSGCCRISGNCSDGPNDHINNPDGDYRVEAIVNVGGSDGSPVSTLPPIINCPENGLCTFTVPGLDPDDGTLNFRLSNSSEAGTGFSQPSSEAGNAGISSNGTYTWDTTDATLSTCGNTVYSTQVTIEDLDGSGNVRDKSAVDFFIQLVPVVGDPPVFDSQTPCGSTFTGNIGSQMTFVVQASDPDSGDTVTLNAAGLPPGATMNPSLPDSGNPVSSIFSWTPTTGEAGIYAMTFTATDSSNQQALCSITVQVFLENCTNGVDDDGDGLVDDADPDCVCNPTCSIKLTGTSPLYGVATDFGNPCSVSKPVEMKIWADFMGLNIVLANIGADGSVILTSGLDKDDVVIVPSNLFDFKTGVKWLIRLIDPVTGAEFCSDSVTIPADPS